MVEKQQLIDRITEEIFQRMASQAPSQAWECKSVCMQEDADQVRFFIECGAERFGLYANGEPAHELARYIDHTLLKPVATRTDIEKLCQEARSFGFASVCINPHFVPMAARLLRGTAVAVCTVIGFPLGANTRDVKSYETRRALFDGAREIDMVINVGALKGHQDDIVLRDIRGVVEACGEADALCKVIIEAAYLSDDEKVRACTLAKEAGAHFVKTSTGFGPGGATVDDVALMRRTVGEGIGVKAAGGIGDSEITRKMIEAGATRIGASAGIKIVQDQPATSSNGY